MDIHKFSFVFLVHFLLALLALDISNAKGLKVGFYAGSCPEAEEIVRNVTAKFIKEDVTNAAPLLRMHFHDCFVRGCDGSVLLNSTKNKPAEKEATPNLTLDGFDIIDSVKSKLEEKCPGVVSCADTIALVARDAVSLIHGPYWEVLTGRRDGRVSSEAEALAQLLPPSFNITQLITAFRARGLSIKDLVVLSGAHTIGNSHCFSFTNRLYNFTGKGDSDPSMDPNYVAKLKKICKPKDNMTGVEMDPGSDTKFDIDYYTLVAKRRGLFTSDAALLNDPETRSYIKRQILTHGSTFGKDFGESMVNMGNIGVLTGNKGEIRKRCAFVN